MKIKDLTKDHIKWKDDIDEHDYPAAASYLELFKNPGSVASIIVGLKSVNMSSFKAKDIFRASELSLLGDKNYHVKKDLQKILNGDYISPLLLVRDTKNNKVIIADGYHRLCSVYFIDEDAVIPCKICNLVD